MKFYKRKLKTGIQHLSLCTAIAVVSIALLASCATRQQFETRDVSAGELKSVTHDKPRELHKAYKRLLAEGKRNAVLNNMKLGLDAMQIGERQEALQAFEKATLGISTIYADNPDAAKARSLWYEEGQKDFKGEPYERAMAFYYLGLLDLGQGDYENARASFKSGIQQDAFAEEDQKRCDFAGLIFLEGWASQLDNDNKLADEAYEEVKKFRPDFTPPTDKNSLVVIETGKSPRKVADGPGHSELKFRRGRGFKEYRAEVSLDGGPYQEAYPMEDLYFQAATRGGRPVDKILKGKAVFRSKNEKIGTSLSSVSDTLMTAGSALSSVPAVMGAGAALGLVSVTHLALAARSRVRADTRYWDNLPDSMHILPMQLSSGDHLLAVRFRDKFGKIVPGMKLVHQFQVNEDKLPLVWLRSRKEMSKDLKY